MKTDKSGFIDLGPIRDVIPVNGGIMPVAYGYILGTLNKIEGDEVDVLVLSDAVFEVGQEIDVEPIALLRRADGDDKIVAVDETRSTLRKWEDIPANEKELIEKFFSYHHAVVSIESADVAKRYIKGSVRKNL